MGRDRDSGPQDDDEALWRYVTKDIKPLGRREFSPARPPARPGRRAVPPSAGEKLPSLPQTVRRGAKEGASAGGIDRRTDEKLRRGQMTIDARIDLHGMGQDAARQTLTRFLLTGYVRGNRCILIITGKGREGKGALRQNLPQWLREGELSAIVLRCYQARPQHGGQGAFYVLLRRQRD